MSCLCTPFPVPAKYFRLLFFCKIKLDKRFALTVPYKVARKMEIKKRKYSSILQDEKGCAGEQRLSLCLLVLWEINLTTDTIYHATQQWCGGKSARCTQLGRKCRLAKRLIRADFRFCIDCFFGFVHSPSMHRIQLEKGFTCRRTFDSLRIVPADRPGICGQLIN